MAIRIIDGVPGSGKSYYAVNHLVENYINLKKPVLIITNIDSLILDHISLDEMITKTSLKEVFNVDNCKKLIDENGGKNLVFLIDEAQKFFHRKYYDVDVFYFFQYHRHLGIDIYLITQNEKLLPIQLTTLSEVVIHSQPRTTSIIGELKYIVKLSGEAIDRKILKPKQEIFDLYSSMSQKEVEKIGNPFLKYAIVAVCLLLVCGYVFKITFLDKGKKAEAADIPPSAKIEEKKEEKKDKGKNKDSTSANPVVCSYVVNPDRSLSVVDPYFNTLVPIQNLERKCTVQKVGKFLRVTLYYSDDEVLKINQKLEKEEAQLKREQARANPNI